MSVTNNNLREGDDDITIEDAAISLNTLGIIFEDVSKNFPELSFNLEINYLKNMIITAVFLIILPTILIGLLIFLFLAIIFTVDWWKILLIAISIIIIGLGFAGIVLAVLANSLKIYEQKLVNQVKEEVKKVKDAYSTNFIEKTGIDVVDSLGKVYLLKDVSGNI